MGPKALHSSAADLADKRILTGDPGSNPPTCPGISSGICRPCQETGPFPEPWTCSPGQVSAIQSCGTWARNWGLTAGCLQVRD